MVTPGNERYLHHMIVTECSPSYENEYLKSNPEPTPGPCLSFHESQPATEIVKVGSMCNKQSMIWHVGGNYVIFLD